MLPARRSTVTRTILGILLTGPLVTNFNEILIEIQSMSLTKIRLKMSSAKCCPFRRGLNCVTLGFISNREQYAQPSQPRIDTKLQWFRWTHEMTLAVVIQECSIHYDVIKWKHFPRYWSFVRGIHRSPVNSPHKGQWRGALMFSLICASINAWVINREAGELTLHRAHYDVIVMTHGEILKWIFVTSHFKGCKQYTSFCGGVCVRNYMTGTSSNL